MQVFNSKLGINVMETITLISSDEDDVIPCTQIISPKKKQTIINKNIINNNNGVCQITSVGSLRKETPLTNNDNKLKILSVETLNQQYKSPLKKAKENQENQLQIVSVRSCQNDKPLPTSRINGNNLSTSVKSASNSRPSTSIQLTLNKNNKKEVSNKLRCYRNTKTNKTKVNKPQESWHTVTKTNETEVIKLDDSPCKISFIESLALKNISEIIQFEAKTVSNSNENEIIFVSEELPKGGISSSRKCSVSVQTDGRTTNKTPMPDKRPVAQGGLGEQTIKKRRVYSNKKNSNIVPPAVVSQTSQQPCKPKSPQNQNNNDVLINIPSLEFSSLCKRVPESRKSVNKSGLSPPMGSFATMQGDEVNILPTASRASALPSHTKTCIDIDLYPPTKTPNKQNSVVKEKLTCDVEVIDINDDSQTYENNKKDKTESNNDQVVDKLKSISPVVEKRDNKRKNEFPVVEQEDKKSRSEFLVAEKKDNSSKSESPVIRKKDNHSRFESPVAEKDNNSRFESPVIRKKDNHSRFDSPVAEKKDNNSRIESPVAEKKDNNSKFESPVIRKKDNHSRFESPVAEKKDNNSRFESPVSEKKENRSSVESPAVEKKDKHFTRLQDLVSSVEKNENDRTKLLAKLQKHYKHAEEKYTSSEQFNKLLKTCITNVQDNELTLYIQLNEIIENLKCQKARKRALLISVPDQCKNNELFDEEKHEEIIVDEKTETETIKNEDRKIKKLNKTLKRLQERIRELEEEEVDLDDEEDSTFFQMQRYRERAVQVHKKICELTGERADAGRTEKKKISFNATQFPEINRAIEKWVNKKHIFPDYQDVLKLIKNEVEEQNLGLGPERMRIIANDVHQKLGKQLQRRRCYDLWDIQSYFLEGAGNDPAEEDPKLNEILEKNKEEFRKKESEVINHFVEKELTLRAKPEEVPDEEADKSPVGSDDEDERELEEYEKDLEESDVERDSKEMNSSPTSTAKIKETKNDYKNCKNKARKLELEAEGPFKSDEENKDTLHEHRSPIVEQKEETQEDNSKKRLSSSIEMDYEIFPKVLEVAVDNKTEDDICVIKELLSPVRKIPNTPPFPSQRYRDINENSPLSPRSIDNCRVSENMSKSSPRGRDRDICRISKNCEQELQKDLKLPKPPREYIVNYLNVHYFQNENERIPLQIRKKAKKRLAFKDITQKINKPSSLGIRKHANSDDTDKTGGGNGNEKEDEAADRSEQTEQMPNMNGESNNGDGDENGEDKKKENFQNKTDVDQEEEKEEEEEDEESVKPPTSTQEASPAEGAAEESLDHSVRSLDFEDMENAYSFTGSSNKDDDDSSKLEIDEKSNVEENSNALSNVEENSNAPSNAEENSNSPSIAEEDSNGPSNPEENSNATLNAEKDSNNPPSNTKENLDVVSEKEADDTSDKPEKENSNPDSIIEKAKEEKEESLNESTESVPKWGPVKIEKDIMKYDPSLKPDENEEANISVKKEEEEEDILKPVELDLPPDVKPEPEDGEGASKEPAQVTPEVEGAATIDTEKESNDIRGESDNDNTVIIEEVKLNGKRKIEEKEEDEPDSSGSDIEVVEEHKTPPRRKEVTTQETIEQLLRKSSSALTVTIPKSSKYFKSPSSASLQALEALKKIKGLTATRVAKVTKREAEEIVVLGERRAAPRGPVISHVTSGSPRKMPVISNVVSMNRSPVRRGYPSPNNSPQARKRNRPEFVVLD